MILISGHKKTSAGPNQRRGEHTVYRAQLPPTDVEELPYGKRLNS